MEVDVPDEGRWAQLEALRDSRSIRRRLGLANVVGAILVALEIVVVGLPATAGSTSAYRQSVVSGVIAVSYFALAILIAFRAAVTRAGRVFGWVDERRTPTADERREALREPWVNARRVFEWWIGAAALYLALNIVFGNPLSYSVRLALNIALGGVATSALTFLILERYNRPVFTVVFEDPGLRGTGLNMRSRFLLTWVLSAALPLVVMATAPIGLSRAHRSRLLGPLLVLLGLGLAAGYVLTIVLARSVVEPLGAVRAAQAQVQSGDLGVEVAVDDGGEMGVLQAGFNRMVDGLRERARLQDLFGRHVGVEVARQALAADVHLGGERRSASVMFVDLVGSTTMAQRLAPEAVVGVLNEFFSAVVRCVKDQGGWVNKFEGDAALCVFGPPGDDPDHARAALRAARSLRSEVNALAKHHDGLDAGIGVSSGGVVAGNIGAEDRYEYTVIGDPVNEAARLTEQAKSEPSRVLASGAAWSAAGNAEQEYWKAAGSIHLRGRDTPTPTFTLP